MVGLEPVYFHVPLPFLYMLPIPCYSIPTGTVQCLPTMNVRLVGSMEVRGHVLHHTYVFQATRNVSFIDVGKEDNVSVSTLYCRYGGVGE